MTNTEVTTAYCTVSKGFLNRKLPDNWILVFNSYTLQYFSSTFRFRWYCLRLNFSTLQSEIIIQLHRLMLSHNNVSPILLVCYWSKRKRLQVMVYIWHSLLDDVASRQAPIIAFVEYMLTDRKVSKCYLFNRSHTNDPRKSPKAECRQFRAEQKEKPEKCI